MKQDIEERALQLAEYIIAQNATVRSAAKHFGVSKSTVHKDITDRLKSIDHELFRKTKRVLDQNKAERHIRGGLATRKKYRGA